jgi:hypothetical protein
MLPIDREEAGRNLVEGLLGAISFSHSPILAKHKRLCVTKLFIARKQGGQNLMEGCQPGADAF